MDWSAPHAGFVLAAYALSGVVITALLSFTIIRSRMMQKKLGRDG